MLAGCLAYQKEISQNAVQLADIIRKGHEVHIQTPSGTNLEFKLAGRKLIIGGSAVSKEDAAEGIVKFLSFGFVEVAADESSANGTVVYDVPIPIRGTKEIRGLTLEFKHGEIVKYSAQAGIDVFESYLKSAQGDVKSLRFLGWV